MSYALPTFNLTAMITTSGDTPNMGPAMFGPLACQKYVLNRRNPNAAWTTYWGVVTPTFRFEPVSFYAIFGPLPNSWAFGYIEFPAASGCFYRCQGAEILHQGFVNEYPVVWAFICDGDGIPLEQSSANDNGFLPGNPPTRFGPHS